MIEVIAFAVGIAVTLAIGIPIFNKFVERRMHSWMETWTEKWDISLETQIDALKTMSEWLHTGLVSPRYLDFKAWYKETYWKACKIHDPYFPERMWMRYEAEDIVYAAEMRKGIK